jgi:hypothetical protein
VPATFQELLHVDDPEVVDAERAQPHHAEIGVTHHYRIGRAHLLPVKPG